jgi:hypothetical protein
MDTKKISESEACERAIDRMLKDVPAEARGYVVLRTVQKAGGMMNAMYPKFMTCPHCGKQRLPVEAHNGFRICRSCREWFPEKAVA